MVILTVRDLSTSRGYTVLGLADAWRSAAFIETESQQTWFFFTWCRWAFVLGRSSKAV